MSQNLCVRKLHLLPKKHTISKFSQLHFSAAKVTRRDGRTADTKMCQRVKCFDTNGRNSSCYYPVTPDRTGVRGYSVASLLKTVHVRHLNAFGTGCFFSLILLPLGKVNFIGEVRPFFKRFLYRVTPVLSVCCGQVAL